MERNSGVAHVRRVEPLSSGWRSAFWSTGILDTAHRPRTELVEGTIRTGHHLLLVTLSGGAERLEVSADCGHHYDGRERPGAVSFVPAHCERRLRLHRVRAEWASLSLPPEFLDGAASGARDGAAPVEIAAFTNLEDPLLAGLVGELRRVLHADGALEPLYAETMGLACASYLARRYGRPAPGAARPPMRLAPWQLRRVAEYVEAHCGGEVRVADLAAQAGLSVGHFHRAFRAATGRTPLAQVQEVRIRRAVAILATEAIPVAELAARVGFLSPGHFARVFRRVTGNRPSRLRRD